MVRNTYPHYLEDSSRQRANMDLDLDVALARMEEVCREKFEVRMEELIFPEKIWLINETNLLSRFMTWGEEDGVTMINLDEFEGELLANESTVHLFKTGKLVSFIRQFNLYDFKKKHDIFVDVDGSGNQLRFGLYYHSFVRMERQDLLRQCVRKVVKRVNLTGNIRIKRSELDSDSEDYVQPKKRRVPVSPTFSKMDVTESNEMDASSEPESPEARTVRRMTKVIPQELPISPGWNSPPSSASIAPPLTMRLRSTPAVPTKEKMALTRQQKDFQRIFWIKRWLEMPEEWRLFPEVDEKRFSDGWMEEYAWNLDPMVVGELAALANCGQMDNADIALTDEELTKWVQELDVVDFPDFPFHSLLAL